MKNLDIFKVMLLYGRPKSSLICMTYLLILERLHKVNMNFWLDIYASKETHGLYLQVP